jgi:hypothetical protein
MTGKEKLEYAQIIDFHFQYNTLHSINILFNIIEFVKLTEYCHTSIMQVSMSRSSQICIIYMWCTYHQKHRLTKIYLSNEGFRQNNPLKYLWDQFCVFLLERKKTVEFIACSLLFLLFAFYRMQCFLPKTFTDFSQFSNIHKQHWTIPSILLLSRGDFFHDNVAHVKIV